ncbi:MAG: glycosyltransferase [Candidatus Eisenbacteria bacterium]
MGGNRKRTGRDSRLSVCLIVRNEEERLPGALESVRSAADEIVVVDTGSEDRTIEIARGAGGVVIERPWTGDFSAARNEGLGAAGGDWVLSLDADERLGAGQEKTLRRLLEGEADAWFVRIRSPLAGGRIYEHRYPRLFRNRPAHRFRGRVHEQIIPALAEAGARVRHGNLLIEHEGYAVERRFAEEKLRRNLRLLLEDHEDRPEDSLVLFHLGETHSLLGDPGKAVECYRKALRASGLPAEQGSAARLGIAAALLKSGDLDGAAAEAERVLNEDRDALPALLVLASANVRRGENERAVAEVDRYLGRTRRLEGKRDRLIRHEPDPGKARLIRAEALLRLGRLDGAARDGAKAALAMPDSAAGPRLLGRIALAERRFDEARLRFRSALEIEPERTDAWRDLVFASLGAGGPGGRRGSGGGGAPPWTLGDSPALPRLPPNRRGRSRGRDRIVRRSLDHKPPFRGITEKTRGTLPQNGKKRRSFKCFGPMARNRGRGGGNRPKTVRWTGEKSARGN